VGRRNYCSARWLDYETDWQGFFSAVKEADIIGRQVDCIGISFCCLESIRQRVAVAQLVSVFSLHKPVLKKDAADSR